MNVVTYDESWMHYFEPHRKISNRVWLTKMQEGLVLPKRITSAKKVMFAIFFTPNGQAIQGPLARRHRKLTNLRRP